jgi:hypothetical protein
MEATEIPCFCLMVVVVVLLVASAAAASSLVLLGKWFGLFDFGDGEGVLILAVGGDHSAAEIALVILLAAFLLNCRCRLLKVGIVPVLDASHVLFAEEASSLPLLLVGELARLDLEEHFGEAVDLRKHEVGVELLELGTCELQVKGAFPDLHEPHAIVLRSNALSMSYPPLEEIRLNLLRHLQQLLQLLQKVEVVEAICN